MVSKRTHHEEDEVGEKETDGDAITFIMAHAWWDPTEF